MPRQRRSVQGACRAHRGERGGLQKVAKARGRLFLGETGQIDSALVRGQLGIVPLVGMRSVDSSAGASSNPGAKLRESVELLTSLLKRYTPAVDVEVGTVVAHLSSTQGSCKDRVGQLRSATHDFIAGLEAAKATLDPSLPIPHLDVSDAAEPSQLATQVQVFVERWSPRDLGCLGNDHRCPRQGKAACKAANFDCYWSMQDPKGTCKGNDSRCRDVDEARCNALESQSVDCKWQQSDEFTQQSAQLGHEMSGILGIAVDIDVLLEGGQRSLAVQRALSMLQAHRLPALHQAMGLLVDTQEQP